MSQLTPFGYQTDPKTYDEFQADVVTATDAKNGACWALGDLYNIANTRWRDKSDQVWDGVKVTLLTLKNYASVCRKFNRNRRNYDLSFGHYDVVKALGEADQDRLLSLAVVNNWSREDLREAWRNDQNIKRKESIKTTCKVVDLIAVLTSPEFGLSENDTIDITAKLCELETEATREAA